METKIYCDTKHFKTAYAAAFDLDKIAEKHQKNTITSKIYLEFQPAEKKFEEDKLIFYSLTEYSCIKTQCKILFEADDEETIASVLGKTFAFTPTKLSGNVQHVFLDTKQKLLRIYTNRNNTEVTIQLEEAEEDVVKTLKRPFEYEQEAKQENEMSNEIFFNPKLTKPLMHLETMLIKCYKRFIVFETRKHEPVQIYYLLMGKV